MSNSKTAASDLFNRYIWLANTLYNSAALTYEEICQKWNNSSTNTTGCEMTLRTFHNHRKAVLELFDIDIQCNKSNGWRYYIANDYAVGDNSLRYWILSSLAVNNLVRESQDLRDKILLEEIPSGLNFLPQIIEALRDRYAIKVTHISFWRDARYEIFLEPYCIKLFRQRWYVIGRNRELDMVRVYAFDRFTDCHTLAEKFDIPDEFDGKQFFDEYFGVYVDSDVKMERVVIEADKVAMNYLRSLPLHHSQQEIQTDDNKSILEFRLRPTVDFITEIVSRSKYIKVLSPQWVIDDVNATISKMAKRQKQD